MFPIKFTFYLNYIIYKTHRKENNCIITTYYYNITIKTCYYNIIN